MKLSVVIPVHNEEACIEKTAQELIQELESKMIPYELILVNDNSSDSTPWFWISLAGIIARSGLSPLLNLKGLAGQ